MNETLVRDWMSPHVIAVTRDATAAEAYKLMSERHVRHLPVVEFGHLLGVISLGDLREVQAPGGTETADHVRAHAMMQSAVVVAHPDETLAVAAKRMLEHKVGCLPVVIDGKVAGMITETDMLRAYIAEHERSLVK
jgi:acetoin utilization protein AcuB